MERGNTKHGPQRDDELARETRDLVRGEPQLGYTEETREPEPVDDPRELFEAEDAAVTEEEAIEFRSELARLLTRDESRSPGTPCWKCWTPRTPPRRWWRGSPPCPVGRTTRARAS